MRVYGMKREKNGEIIRDERERSWEFVFEERKEEKEN